MVNEIEIASEIKSFDIVRQFIRANCSDENISRKLYGRIYISVSELVSNSIVHGNQFSAEKKVKLRLNNLSNRWEITVEDEGCGFDPKLIPDPLLKENLTSESGRGIFIVKNYSDEFFIDKSGRRITLIFYK